MLYWSQASGALTPLAPDTAPVMGSMPRKGVGAEMERVRRARRVEGRESVVGGLCGRGLVCLEVWWLDCSIEKALIEN